MLQLRPHHLIDIIRDIGHDRPLVPHPYGLAQHMIAQSILDRSDLEILLTVGPDDICKSCIHLTDEGFCADVLSQLKFKVGKQQYNDALDHRVLDYLGLKEGSIVLMEDFINLVELKITGLVSLCIHPKEKKEYRVEGLRNGLGKLRSSRSLTRLKK